MKGYTAILSLVLLAILLFGCMGGQQPPAQPPSTNQTPPGIPGPEPSPECSGSISLNLNPSKVKPSDSITPSASGLANCGSKLIYFKNDSCSGTQVSFCTLRDGGCVGPSFTAPSNDGLYTYYACVDKNNDADYTDSGEYSSKILNVSQLQVSWLHIDGKWIKDEQGNVVFLHGVNFEGYEFGDYHRGYQFFNHSEEDYKRIADMGFNVVRLPIVWQYIESKEGYYEERYFTNFVDKDIEFAKKYGLYIILDFHKFGWSPYFNETMKGGIPDGLPNWMVNGYSSSWEGRIQAIKDFWLGKGPNGTEATLENPSQKDRMIAVWRYIAERYKDNPTVVGYDLFNEPSTIDLPTDYAYDFFEILIDNISAVDNSHIFIYEVVSNGSTVTNTTTKVARLLNRDDIIFSFHEYLPQNGYHNNFTKLEEYLLKILESPKSNPIKNWNIPIYVGEFGCVQFDDQSNKWQVVPNGSQFMSDLPVLLNKYNFHWTVWSYSNGGSPFRIVFPNGSERKEWTNGLVIPYLRRSSIPPSYSYFDQTTKNFKLVFDDVGNVKAEIYVPYRHYPNGFTVNANTSQWSKSWEETNRVLTIQATLGGAVEITIEPNLT